MTPQSIDELLSDRLAVIQAQRELNNKLYAKDGKPERDFTDEEQGKYNELEAKVKVLTSHIDRAKNLSSAEKAAAEVATLSVRAALDPTSAEGVRGTPEYRKAFVAWMKNGDGGTPMDLKATLQKAISTSGGYLVPIEFETKIVERMYDANVMRQLATVIRTTSQVDIPLEGNLPTFGWIDELGAYPATDMTFSGAVLSAYKLGGIITVSEELMDDAFIDLDDYISRKSATSAGFAEEAAFVLGDGNKKPTGFTSAAGVSTTSASNATVTSVDMYALMYGLSRPYRKNGTFMVADSVLSKLRQEKSTTGQYLWNPSLTANAPDVYLGKPIVTSDFMAPLASGSVSSAFGDFSFYQIVDRIGWSMQILKERYADSGQVGFRMWERLDGKLLRPEAIATQTTHA